MNIQQIKYVIEIYDSGTYTAAASNLYVTEPTISQQVRKLESELGVRLFERSTRSLTPTEAGTVFAEYARQVIAAYDKLEEAMHIESIRKQDKITVRMTASEQVSSLMRFANEYKKLHETQIEIKADSEVVIRKDLLDGRIDMVITKLTPEPVSSYPSDKFIINILRHDTLNVLTSDNLIGRSKSSLRFEDLAGLPVICDAQDSAMEKWIKAHYDSVLVPLEISMYTLSPEVMIAAVENSMGIAFADGSIAKHYQNRYRFNCIPLAPTISNDLCLIEKRGGEKTPQFRKFKKELTDYYR